ncbi:hypothetical protein PFICI_10632 [Pestalotiopsis fici W106-1]|uniref:Uncharacterized protein n=1 Tax=Pestalotiopsis fici (strain W106-1 / CGMCC3.15140) TaxID=1229662 RepID=W3WXJ9_PESFW|nr:uncharacterized protein PFICI_10632 [Pestalotiopsis fici W106-1]ETS78570.1 hypothetical protein PFICI_10632 [Pestalotiopsis fici W106-1]
MKSSIFLVLVSSALALSAALPHAKLARSDVAGMESRSAHDARDDVCPDGRSGYNCSEGSEKRQAETDACDGC